MKSRATGEDYRLHSTVRWTNFRIRSSMGEPNMSAFLDIESGFIRIRFKVLQMFTNPHNNKKLFLEISHNVSYCADSKNINLAK